MAPGVNVLKLFSTSLLFQQDKLECLYQASLHGATSLNITTFTIKALNKHDTQNNETQHNNTLSIVPLC